MNKRFLSAFDPFNWIIKDRNRGIPPWDGTSGFVVHSRDSVRIEGWGWNPDYPRGTLFFLHGFTGHCGSQQIWDAGAELSKRFNVGLVAHDARHHGRSEDRPITFGTAEMWDFQAVLDEAERRDYAKPFIVIGDSLGAMTGQRTAIVDGRIHGAFLMHPPGWPYDALGVSTKYKVSVDVAAAIINFTYKWDILTDGDIRRHPSHPAHEPYVLYIMGDQDHFGSHKTRLAYKHWYRGSMNKEGFAPCQEQEARKWFVSIPGAVHSERGEGNQVWHFHGFSDILSAFISRCLEG